MCKCVGLLLILQGTMLTLNITGETDESKSGIQNYYITKSCALFNVPIYSFNISLLKLLIVIAMSHNSKIQHDVCRWSI